MATRALSSGNNSNSFIRLSLSPPFACPWRSLPTLASKTIIDASPPYSKVNKLGLVFGGSKGLVSISQNPLLRVVAAVARAKHDRLGEDDADEEIKTSNILPMLENLVAVRQRKTNKLSERITYGLAIGITLGIFILAGGWVFTVAVAAAVFAGASEYFELIRSHGITAGMEPPPQHVSQVCSVVCALMPIFTLYFGQIDVAVTCAAFLVAIALILQRENPRFTQLSSSVFGLFYCGYHPCFWVKLRCGLAVPALNSRIGASWPYLLGGQAHWTVGLVATLISISSIVAADTYAFMGGKAFGRTPLTSISPKKTWEGTIIGLGGCVATSVVLSKAFSWPSCLLSAVAFGCLNFVGSIFGDLTESMIKRDAGVKDSGTLIPGHGWILDRVDNYIFTGSLAYTFVKIFLPLYGV